MPERENITVPDCPKCERNEAKFAMAPKDAQAKIEELEYANDVLKSMVDRWEATASKHLDLVNALKVQRDELEDKANSYLDRIERLKKDFGVIYRENKGLREATNGHTLESIREIMKAVPPAEILKGSRLEVQCSGETMKTDEVAMWAPCIYVYPIAEYIKGDEIDHELAKQCPKCEIVMMDGTTLTGDLVAVEADGTCYIYANGEVTQEPRINCRIKKSDLKKES